MPELSFIEQIAACIPASPQSGIPWSRIDRLLSAVDLAGMRKTQQNAAYHGEGDVYTHTKMVCRELLENAAFYRLPDRQKTELFLAALLHDVGKVKTTRSENGSWASPHHAFVGSQLARQFLWADCGLCGTRESIRFRESVCALIRWHMLPLRLMEQDDPERKLREAAAVGELAEDFSWRLLCMLAEADVKGRLADDVEDGLAQLALAEMAAEEAGCLGAPYPFFDGFVRRAYLSGRGVQPDQSLYNNSWGEVTLLSGLPGTGKDTWIRGQASGQPVISLDGLRAELAVSPTEDQGELLRTAQERARELLRKQQPFVWNATDLTKETRQKLIGLFERYGARVRIVYLETDWETRKKRNLQRAAAVPENAVSRMLEKTTPPTPEEAQTVQWLCV